MRSLRPTQGSLERALEGATRARIADVPELGGTELLTLGDPEDVGELVRLLAIVPPTEAFHCMCPGDQAIEFSRGRRTVTVTLHHGRSIRWERWDSDALLADGEGLLRWLADRGAPGPLREWEADRRRAEEANLAWQAWQRAAPPEIVSFLPDLMPSVHPEYPSEQLLLAEGALRAAHPQEHEAILVLLEWFGSGAGPWSGFPSYETVPEALLLRHGTDAIVAALGDEPLPPARAEGAARLLASWWFNRMRPGEARSLPRDLKRRLREHVHTGGDPDKAERLAGALER